MNDYKALKIAIGLVMDDVDYFSGSEAIKLKKIKMISFLLKNNGIVSKSCKELRISTLNHYNWLKEDDFYRKTFKEIEQIKLDFVEDQMFKKIEKGDSRMIIYYLSQKGVKRGYGKIHDINIGINELPLFSLEKGNKEDNG